MEIGIKVMAENIAARTTRHANSCFFTMVAVDDARKPVAVPRFEPTNDEERRRYEAAKLRKELRQQFSARQAAIKVGVAGGA
jgi:acyl-CoA hydrolase